MPRLEPDLRTRAIPTNPFQTCEHDEIGEHPKSSEKPQSLNRSYQAYTPLQLTPYRA